LYPPQFISSTKQPKKHARVNSFFSFRVASLNQEGKKINHDDFFSHMMTYRFGEMSRKKTNIVNNWKKKINASMAKQLHHFICVNLI